MYLCMNNVVKKCRITILDRYIHTLLLFDLKVRIFVQCKHTLILTTSFGLYSYTDPASFWLPVDAFSLFCLLVGQ
jgi:hypothetical protein